MAARKVAALIMAAGRGERFGGGLPKQYLELAGRPIVARAIDGFSASGAIDCIACVIDPDARRRFEQATAGRRIDIVAHGGAARQDSVRNGLEALAAQSAPPDAVLIHDAARPLAPSDVIERLLAKLGDVDAAAPVLPLTDTVSTLAGAGFGPDVDRAALVRRQTPQAFRFAPILAAHRRFRGRSATDDIALALEAGMSTATVPGSPLLRKITVPEDFMILEALLAGSSRPSVGNGFDVHAFGPGDHVMLCGVPVPHSHGLVGHSDADVAIHALTDAMLGAVGAGDIGALFPPSDPQWKGAASHIFLEHARDAIVARGGRLESVDVTIVCETPKVGPHRDVMRQTLARWLGLAPDRVSVKATTTEGLGFTGRREGVAAMATATVSLFA